jgi:hypothetical protein
LDSTLRTVTDGLGTASPFWLSTTNVSFGGASGLNWDNANNRLGIGTNTPLGILHLKTAATTTRLVLDGDAAQSKIITYRTAGLQRFGLYTNNTAESGANAGSDFAIRAYSDAGSLLSTPIFIKRSSGNVGIGTTTANARLHVTGNGTNPVARFESSIGNLNIISVKEDDFSIAFGSGTLGTAQIGLQNLANPIAFANTGNGQAFVYKSNFNSQWPGPMHSFWGESNIYTGITQTNNSAGIAAFNGTFGITNSSASTFDYRILNINYTINNTAASNRTATGIFLNATETALNGMVHNLMDIGTGGGTYVSRFRVSSTGDVLRITTNPAGDRGFRINAGSNIPIDRKSVV